VVIDKEDAVSQFSELFGGVLEDLKEKGPEILASVAAGGSPIPALIGLALESAKAHAGKQAEALGIAVNADQYADRIAGDPGVKEAFRSEGDVSNETTPKADRIRHACTNATILGELHDLQKLAGKT
jgi:hypothetical protein